MKTGGARLHDRSDDRENSNSERKVADDCLSTNILAAEAKAINNEGGQVYVSMAVQHRKLQVRSKQAQVCLTFTERLSIYSQAR